MRAGLLLVAAAGVAAAGWVFLRPELAALDPHAMASRVRAAGPLGTATLFAVLVLQCILAPVPSEPLMMAAGFVYGTAGGFAIGWSAILLGATGCFLLARTIGHPLVERLVRPERLARFEGRFGDRGHGATFVAVLGLRLFAFTSFDVVSYACGLIPFPFRWFVIATAIGAVPKVFAFTHAGASARRPVWLDVVIVGGTFGVLALGWWLMRAPSARDRGRPSTGTAPDFGRAENSHGPMQGRTCDPRR